MGCVLPGRKRFPLKFTASNFCEHKMSDNLRGFWNPKNQGACITEAPKVVRKHHSEDKVAAESCSFDGIVAYTDGACNPNPGPGAYGAVLLYGKNVIEIGGFDSRTTNNRMELMAAIVALESIHESVKVHLHTDSKYVLNGITAWVSGWIRNSWKTKSGSDVLNKDLWQRLHKQNTRLKVRWTWVKGHSGIEYNERADQIAAAYLLANT